MALLSNADDLLASNESKLTSHCFLDNGNWFCDFFDDSFGPLLSYQKANVAISQRLSLPANEIP